DTELCSMCNKILKLHPSDNVLIAISALEAGQAVAVDDASCTARVAIPRYFKVALRKIERGERIVKCGVPIGIAVQAIAAGDIVHTHNIKSDYMTSFTGND